MLRTKAHSKEAFLGITTIPDLHTYLQLFGRLSSPSLYLLYTYVQGVSYAPTRIHLAGPCPASLLLLRGVCTQDLTNLNPSLELVVPPFLKAAKHTKASQHSTHKTEGKPNPIANYPESNGVNLEPTNPHTILPKIA